MKLNLFKTMSLSLFLSAYLLAAVIMPVSARGGSVAIPPLLPLPLKPTQITLMEIPAKSLGTPFDMAGSVRSGTTPISNTTIVITLDGKFLGQTSSDDNGQFLFNVHQDLPAGSYHLAAHYTGTRLQASANAEAVVQINPALVVVQTVPPIGGIQFTMNGQTFISNAQGEARVSIPKSGTYHLDVKTDQYNNPTQRITFGRWEDENFMPSRDIVVPTNGPIQVGFDVFHQVDQTFVDLAGLPVNPDRISGITIKSAQGDIFSYQEGEELWVPASRINRRSTGLEITQLLYSVNVVTVDGSNVVNKAQQRFYSGADLVWKISLTLYSIQVSAKDLLFGTPLGDQVALFYPSGKVDHFKLDANGSANLPSLARGIYNIKLSGTNGIETLTPVALSRNQVINENVISYRDLIVVGGLGLLLALSLIFIGRPWLLIPRLRRVRSAAVVPNEMEGGLVHDHQA